MQKEMTPEQDFMKKTKVQLIAIGKKLGIKGLHPLKKAEIVKRLISKQKESNNKTPIETISNIPKKEDVSTSKAKDEPKKSDETVEETKHKENEYAIPNEYGDTKIVAMVRDPECVFCYWEINPQERLERRIDKLKVILRVYDITDIDFNGENAHSFFDIGLKGIASNWYINIPEPEKDYCIDLGYFDTNGIFHLIARSNRVSVPRNTFSKVYDEEWMSVEELLQLSGGDAKLSFTGGSLEIEQMLVERLKMSASSEVHALAGK